MLYVYVVIYYRYKQVCSSHFCVFNFFHLKELQEKKIILENSVGDVGRV